MIFLDTFSVVIVSFFSRNSKRFFHPFIFHSFLLLTQKIIKKNCTRSSPWISLLLSAIFHLLDKILVFFVFYFSFNYIVALSYGSTHVISIDVFTLFSRLLLTVRRRSNVRNFSLILNGVQTARFFIQEFLLVHYSNEEIIMN